MAKVVVRSLKTPRGRSGKSGTLATKRVRGSDGVVTTLHTLDAESVSFGSELRDVFERSVAKARRENRRITGANDVVPAKT